MTDPNGVSDEAAKLEQMHVAELRTENAFVLADAQSIVRDLTFVQDCCRHLLGLFAQPEDERDTVSVEALWTAALIAYVRCFNTGTRSGLTREDVLAAPFEGDVIGAHEYFRGMRDQHVAHSVNPFESSLVGAVLSPPARKDRKVECLAFAHVRQTATDLVGVNQLGRLCDWLIDRKKEQIEELTAVVQAEAEAIDLDSLYAQPNMTYTAPGPQHVRTNRRPRRRSK